LKHFRVIQNYHNPIKRDQVETKF
jgi:hypothetical protein